MRLSGIILFVIIFSVSGCNLFNSETELSDKLVGTWEHEVAVNTERSIKVIHNYHFMDINTYELIEEHYDLQGNFLGYRILVEGSYSLKGNTLVMKINEAYRSINDELYSTIEELKAAGVEEDQGQGENQSEYRTEFSNNNATVTLLFTCPPNASCTAPPVLNRVPKSGPDIF